ncbi:MAG: hypothetical protein NT124_01590 [Candidatus Dependentiae bacterium]|nr:hypothetical protein [Candidatus Dependentiae bacterium]
MNSVLKKICLGVLVASCSTTLPMFQGGSNGGISADQQLLLNMLRSMSSQNSNQPAQQPFVSPVKDSFPAALNKLLAVYVSLQNAKKVAAHLSDEKVLTQLPTENDLSYYWRVGSKVYDACSFLVTGYEHFGECKKYMEETLFGKNYVADIEKNVFIDVPNLWANKEEVESEKKALQKELAAFVACENNSEALENGKALLTKWDKSKAGDSRQKFARFVIYRDLIVANLRAKGFRVNS